MMISRSTLSNALRVASARFKDHATELLLLKVSVNEAEGYERLAAQFTRQAKECTELADSMDNGDAITLVD